MRNLILFIVLIISTNFVYAQVKDDNFEAKKKDFLSFYSGKWKGEGEFSNGKKIAAEIKFQYDADIDSILYRHSDVPPNKYKSLAIWKINSQKNELVGSFNDAFGVVRIFISKDWQDKKLTFENVNIFNDTNFGKQRFLFEPLSDDSFKMTYETDRDGKGWKMGDYLVFKRVT